MLFSFSVPLTKVAVDAVLDGCFVEFWVASGAGTAALVTFGLSRGGAEGGDPLADALVAGAVVASSWC